MMKEIPPRARRRVQLPQRFLALSGNTSACAEKSASAVTPSTFGRKYLRVRGEEVVRYAPCRAVLEIPPRARRRGDAQVLDLAGIGNTSACAEKSGAQRHWEGGDRKYLRVRGEEAQ